MNSALKHHEFCIKNAELCNTLQEWKWISQEMNEPKWYSLCQRVSEIVDELPKQVSNECNANRQTEGEIYQSPACIYSFH